MSTLHDLIADAKPPARTVEVCLRGDLTADLERATRALALATANEADTTEAMAQIAALRKQMAAATVEVTLTAMPRGDWLSLIAGHPPRDGNDTDQRVGFNTETFYDAAIRRSWAAPEATDDDLTGLLGALNDRQFNDLADAAWSVNAGGVSVPFGWRDWSPMPG